MNGYSGPVYAGSGDAATELQRPSHDPGAAPSPYTYQSHQQRSRERGDTLATEHGEDDRAGLLNYSAQPGLRRPSDQSHSPYRPYTNDEFAPGDDSQLDLGAGSAHPGARLAGAVSPPKRMDYGDVETGYLGAGGQGGGAGGMHPAYRKETGGVGSGHGDEWNHWAGVARGSADDENLRSGARR